MLRTPDLCRAVFSAAAPILYLQEFTFSNSVSSLLLSSPFLEKNTEAQSGELTCLGGHTGVVELGSWSQSLCFGPCATQLLRPTSPS